MLGFLIAVAAGAVTPMLEGPVARPLAQAMGDTVEVADGELRTLAFMIAMIVAGLLCSVQQGVCAWPRGWGHAWLFRHASGALVAARH